MALAHVRPDGVLYLGTSDRGLVMRKECLMHFLRGVPPCPADHDLVALFLPFEDRARADTEFLSNLGWYGDLALSGKLGFR